MIQAAERPTAIRAIRYISGRPSYSSPRLVVCDNGKNYYIKGMVSNRPLLGRALVSEQVVGRIGLLIGAPVANVELVELPHDLIRVNPAIAPMLPGICHGSEEIKDVSADRSPIAHTAIVENRARFALLAILYGLCVAQDHQYVYSQAEPRLVHSFDHGHFFPGGPEWTIQSLTAPLPDPIAPDINIYATCSFSNEEMEIAADQLRHLTDQRLASILASPSAEWGVPVSDRGVMGVFLAQRRDALVATFAHKICAGKN